MDPAVYAEVRIIHPFGREIAKLLKICLQQQTYSPCILDATPSTEYELQNIWWLNYIARGHDP